MKDNYKNIEHQLRKYSFEFLKVSPEPLHILETLNRNNPNMITDAQKPSLLAAAIVYIYLKRNNLNGRGGITVKDLAEHFKVKASTISQKVFDVEIYLNIAKKIKDDEIYEFIDEDRFEVNELYWEFIESPDADDIKKSIKILKAIIKKDPDYYDPYITLHEYYILNGDIKKAGDILEQGFKRAIDLIDNNGRFPDELPWGFTENRHIIRMIFNFATFVWAGGNKDIALKIFLELLKSNVGDNIGARYSIVAILEGFESQEEYEEAFESDDGMSLEYMALEEWFSNSALKHKDVIGWWFDLDNE